MKVVIINAYWHTRSPYLNYVLVYEAQINSIILTSFIVQQQKFKKL